MPNYSDRGLKETRAGFGAGLKELVADKRVVALCADLCGSVKMDAFAKEVPDRYIECGIAEANMIGTAAGLAVGGYIPFVGTFAAFATGRVYDQIRQSVAYSNLPVKIAASHAGLTLGEDGATHQILEDVGMMRMLPNMTVIAPCDYEQTRLAILAARQLDGPVYLRFGRPAVPTFTSPDEPFQIGKAQRLLEGKAFTIISYGHMVWPSLQVAQRMHGEGIPTGVLNMHTLKPLDEEAIAEAARRGPIVTVEEHMRAGGLGEAVASVLGRFAPAPLEIVAVEDRFGESGKPMELLAAYGLDEAGIERACRKVLARL